MMQKQSSGGAETQCQPVKITRKFSSIANAPSSPEKIMEKMGRPLVQQPAIDFN
jgi:hypothetical protein